jgi:hypothetical protein
MTDHFDDTEPDDDDRDRVMAELVRALDASPTQKPLQDDATALPNRSISSRDKELPKQEVVGGFAFFLSLAAILPTGLIILFLSLRLISTESIGYAGTFLCAVLVGAVGAHCLIKDHISVLIHEFKHSLVSNLVGNKRKGMKIDRDSGYFEYAYSKQTKHFNAFISLAPYIVPVFTFISGLIAFALLRHEHVLAVLVVGIGYGMDLVLNIRDISPIQTDLTLIRGGYRIGVLYVAAWNVLIFAFLVAWILQGLAGLAHLLESLSIFFVQVHQWYSQLGTPEE